MKLKKFENLNIQQPYIIENGELKRTKMESIAQLYLTDEEYDKVKKLANSVKEKCENFDRQKELEIQRLKLVISQIKKSSSEKYFNKK
jgi:hydroxymethylpyrimidine pyrophosphatase-like HAD family hydrolase